MPICIRELLPHRGMCTYVIRTRGSSSEMPPKKRPRLPEAPDEVWLVVFQFLDVHSLCLVGIVSRRFKALSDDETLWERLARRFLGPEQARHARDKTWKAVMRKLNGLFRPGPMRFRDEMQIVAVVPKGNRWGANYPFDMTNHRIEVRETQVVVRDFLWPPGTARSAWKVLSQDCDEDGRTFHLISDHITDMIVRQQRHVICMRTSPVELCPVMDRPASQRIVADGRGGAFLIVDEGTRIRFLHLVWNGMVIDCDRRTDVAFHTGDDGRMPRWAGLPGYPTIQLFLPNTRNVVVFAMATGEHIVRTVDCDESTDGFALLSMALNRQDGRVHLYSGQHQDVGTTVYADTPLRGKVACCSWVESR